VKLKLNRKYTSENKKGKGLCMKQKIPTERCVVVIGADIPFEKDVHCS
jgi:hypothetical protein